MNINFLKQIISGTWHVNFETYLEYAPLRDMILKHNLQFEKNTDNSALPFFVAAENYSRFDVITDTDNGDMVSVTVVSGVLTQSDQYCGNFGTTRMAANMEKADKLRNVIGHILFIDSGGGQTISLDPFKELMPNLQKPVVAFVKNMAASAAYGVASFAQEIYASKPDAIVGSIGTMISFDGFPANTVTPDGLRHVRLYASKSDKKNETFEAALNGDYKPMIEHVLNPTNEDFISMIQTNRAKVSHKFTDGSDYRAADVVGTLVDGIQTFEATINRVVELAKKQNVSSNKTNSNSFKTMGTKQKILMLSALAAMFDNTLEVDAEGFISLSSEQAQTVNSMLAELTGVKAKLTELENSLASANATITERNATIDDLNSQIATLSNEPGASSAKLITDTDPKPDGVAKSVYANGSFEDMASIFKI